MLPHIRLPGFLLRTAERKLLLRIVDLAILSAALVIAIALRTTWMEENGMLVLLANFKWFVTLALIWLPVATLVESYDLARAASAPHSIISASIAAGVTLLIYFLVPWLTPPLISRGLLYIFVALALGGIAVWRGLYAVLFVQPNFQQRALVLGAGQAGQALAEALQPLPTTGNPFRGTGYHIVGFVDDDPTKQSTTIGGIPVLGGCDELPDLTRRLDVDEVVLAITHRHTMSQQAFDALLACREQGIHVTTMPALYERVLGRIPVEHIGRDLHVVLPVSGGPTERLYEVIKRIADLLLGAIGIAVLGIASLVVALANALFCPGPLFYQQARVGRGGRLFDIWKFRTMVPNAEQATGAVWACDNDPRNTPVGRRLRRARIDELPQMINVLRGDMSIIGPRPERPEFVQELAERLPFYRARHAIRPGLTGWAQVRFGYGNSVEDARTKLEYDLYYVKHAGFYLDLLILLKTLAVVLKLQGQ